MVLAWCVCRIVCVMRWPWRRRWGWAVLVFHPCAGGAARTVWPARYWTRRGAQWAADGYLVETARLSPDLRKRVGVEVLQIPRVGPDL